MPPVVSVVIPVLNAAPYLSEAIESILAQSFGDLELILVDDGSNDGSLEIAASYARKERRVRQFALPRNPHGTSGARASNAAIAEARGAYIARMDADDIATPDRFAFQLEAMRERQLDLCGGQTLRFGDRKGEIWYPEDHQAIASELVFRPALANATMLVRAGVLRAARFSEADSKDDYELQTRLVSQCRMGNCGEVLLSLRVHDAMTTRVRQQQKSQSMWRLRFRYFFRMFPDADIRDFSCVNAVARGAALSAVDELATAGRWLVRLSRLPDMKLRRRMARRWADACELARVCGVRAEALREPYEARILAPPW